MELGIGGRPIGGAAELNIKGIGQGAGAQGVNLDFLVIEVPGAQLDILTTRVAVFRAGITEILASETGEAGQPTARIEIGLDTDTENYQVVPLEKDLYISFPKPAFSPKRYWTIELLPTSAMDCGSQPPIRFWKCLVR